MSPWTIAWVSWFVLVFVGFWAIEWPAIKHEMKHGSGATLTAHIRDWFDTRDKPKGWQRRRLLLLTILVMGPIWAILHFFLGW